MADLQTSITAALKSAGALWRLALPKVWAPLLALAMLNFTLSPALHTPPIWLPLIFVADILALSLAYGGLMRLALADRHSGEPEYQVGPAGLQWNGIETRVLGAVALLAALAALLTIATVFLVMLVTIAVAAGTGAAPKAGATILAGPSVIAGGIALAASAVLILGTFLRLSLAMPATVDRRQVQVFSTWGITQGRVVALFAALLAVTLPTIILGLAARWLQGAPGEATAPMAMILWALYALIAGLAQTPLIAGVTAWFYRQAIEAPASASTHN
jgi:hypothetical protein